MTDDGRGEEEDLGSEEGDMEVDNSVSATIPGTLKALRACKRCTLIKTVEQFLHEGCDNCPFLSIKDDSERVNDCTSPYFTGMIAMLQPKKSWVSKWQRTSDCKPGMYAVEVIGEFPKEIQENLESIGIGWRCKPA